jgi:altronate hydrolase
MDVNTGTIATGDDTVEGIGQRLFEIFIETASGRPTCSEQLGFGDADFLPWQSGVVT